MNFKLTITLLIVLLVLGGGIWYLASRPEKAAAEGPEKAVLVPQPSELNAITVQRAGKTVLALARAGDKWMLEAPVQARTEDWRISSLARDIRDLTYRDKFEPDATGRRSLEDLGLKEPRAIVTLRGTGKDGNALEHTLLVGKRSPLETLFVRIQGDAANTVYEVPLDWWQRLDAPAEDLRAKQILDLDAGSVTAVTVAHPEENIPGVRVEKAGVNWDITQPIPTRANTQVIEDLVDQLRRLQATSFSPVTRDNPAAGLATPRLSVSLTTAQPAIATTATATAPAGRTVTVDFGHATDLRQTSVYASVRGSDEVAIVPVEAFNKLNKKLHDLRDPRVVAGDISDAATIHIQNANGPAITLVKDGTGTWKMDAPVRVNASETAVRNVLEAVRSLRANKYLDAAGDLKSLGLDKPRQTITLVMPFTSPDGVSGMRKETLTIGTPQEAEPLTAVQRAGDNTVYLVRTEDLATLSPAVLALRDRTVERLPTDRISAITIAPAKGQKTVLERQGAQWQANGKPADAEKVANLLAALSPLEADEWLATTPPAGKPELTVTVTFSETASTAPAMENGPQPVRTASRTLVLTQEKDAWQAAWSGGVDPTWAFTPAAPLVDALTEESFVKPAATATAPASQPATAPAN